MAGRKSKFNKGVVAAIIEALTLGGTVQMACDFSGISKSTYYQWITKGEKQKSGQFKTFVQQVKEASAKGAMAHLGTIFKASKSDWKASAWLLERRYGYQKNGTVAQDYVADIELPDNTIDILKEQARELKKSMAKAELSQSWQAYAALQRQFITVITQIRQIEAEEGSGDELDGLTDEQLLFEITNAIISLPPILRQRLESSVKDMNNVIVIGETK